MINTISLRQFFKLWIIADEGHGIRNLLATVSMSSLRPALQDADNDGLADGIEALLLFRFRPYYLFSTNNGNDESYLPTSYKEYLKRCGLILRMDSGDVEFSGYGTFANDATAILSINCPADGVCPADLTKFHDRTNYRLQVDAGFYQGFDDGRDIASHWNDIVGLGNVGLYGHVVPDENGNYKIEYWQFYAYNNANQAKFFDHECDLECVHLVVSAATLEPMSTTHFVHGKPVAFEIGSIKPFTNGNIHEYAGKNYNLNDIDLYSSTDAAQNNLVRFYAETMADGSFGEYTHLMVYIEYGTHASWPSELWDYFGAPDHSGDSHQFLTSTPPNLGEVENPLSDEARVILQFSGYWGSYAGPGLPGIADNDNSPGASLHRSWLWPNTSAMLRQLIPDSAFE